jgi:hypothetical protein
MKHFRNQHYHNEYDRHLAVELLEELEGGILAEHDIPPRKTLSDLVSTYEDFSAETDSPAEDDFLTELAQRGFPLPDETQYSVDLGGGEMTVADFAYPQASVLVFIDGLSEQIHGNPAQTQKDRLQRAKAKMKGYFVLEIPAQALKDDTMLSGYLDELALYLNS